MTFREGLHTRPALSLCHSRNYQGLEFRMTNYTLDQQFLEQCIESGTQAYKEGEYATGAKIFLKALKQGKRSDLKDGRMATVLYNLAHFYFLNGRLRKAELFLERALDQLLDAGGEYQPGIAAVCEKLADVAFKQCRPERAECMYARSLAVDKALNRPSDPAVSRKLAKLARVYSAMGRHDEAFHYTKLALEVKARARQLESNN
jgi:tetratricopeptide (TPR) repeat protein